MSTGELCPHRAGRIAGLSISGGPSLQERTCPPRQGHVACGSSLHSWAVRFSAPHRGHSSSLSPGAKAKQRRAQQSEAEQEWGLARGNMPVGATGPSPACPHWSAPAHPWPLPFHAHLTEQPAPGPPCLPASTAASRRHFSITRTQSTGSQQRATATGLASSSSPHCRHWSSSDQGIFLTSLVGMGLPCPHLSSLLWLFQQHHKAKPGNRELSPGRDARLSGSPPGPHLGFVPRPLMGTSSQLHS